MKLLELSSISKRFRLIAIKKKDKPPDKVQNLRAIQILPTNVRLLEQSATDSKDWLIEQLRNKK